MNRSSRRLVGFATLTFVVACGEDPAPTILSPNLAIADAAHDGNEHFFFLPPMSDQPDAQGTFDGSLVPQVVICVWDGTACGATLASFTTEVGYGSETIRVSAEDEQYVVNWHTGEILDNYALGVDETFRVRVLAEGQELGFADITVVGQAKELKLIQTDEFIPLLDGRTLPIKFRIEDGAIASGGAPISGGYHHSCAVAANGDGYCWGQNSLGQLGTGVLTSFEATPQLVVGGHQWKSIEAGREHTCGLTTDGDIYCWGYNRFGQVGIGTIDFVRYSSPQLTVGGQTYSALAAFSKARGHESCGVTTDGDMYCWGYNGFGELGRGTITYAEPTPGLVVGGQVFAGPAGTGYSTCAVTTSGDAYCWGLNNDGQLGRGHFVFWDPTPGQVTGGHTFESITVGFAHACGVDTTGAAFCWGRNQEGELGQGTVSAPDPTPGAVTGGHSFTALSAGGLSTCGVRDDGAGLCWGWNLHGQLGNGSSGSDDPTPGVVNGGHAFESIATGYAHACGVTTSGDVFCWGWNQFGVLGDGTTFNRTTPVFAIDLDPTFP